LAGRGSPFSTGCRVSAHVSSVSRRCSIAVAPQHILPKLGMREARIFMTRSIVRPFIAAAVLMAGSVICQTAPDVASASAPQERAAAPIALHADNPHYFQWRGRPTVLITSGEHYGAVVNLDFDYHRYLDTLAGDGMNYARVFSGAYVEPQGAFNITRNTMAPQPGRFIAPWPRSGRPGYANGGNTFDLGRWDEAYFARLKDFIAYAASKNIVVELSLFCPMYDDKQWMLSPMNPANNVNSLGTTVRTDVYTLDRHGGLLAVQEALARNIITALNSFENLFFEICNEPYEGGVTTPWQHHIADVIVETERDLPAQHLIAQNIANKSAKIVSPHPAVSIFNFHYATPPDTVAINYPLNKVVGDDETGFRGIEDTPYRTEAWDFILAGGGLFNNLDYSFVAGQEDGTFEYPASQPGGGSRALRRQLKVLSDFINGFDFVRMAPDTSMIKGGVPAGSTVRALLERDSAMAIYVRTQSSKDISGESARISALQIELTDGIWQVEWIDTKDGTVIRTTRVDGGGIRAVDAPTYDSDIALRIRRR
jgi:hypothetical protein